MVTNVTKSQQLKAASKRYAACLFGDFERALADDCKKTSFTPSWAVDCHPNLLPQKEQLRLKRYVKKEVKHLLKHFRYYSHTYQLDIITIDIVDSELCISGRITLRTA